MYNVIDSQTLLMALAIVGLMAGYGGLANNNDDDSEPVPLAVFICGFAFIVLALLVNALLALGARRGEESPI